MDQYCKLSKESSANILDLNAHVGGFCLRVALAYPKSKIDCIEYSSDIHELLLKNINTLKIKNITTFCKDSYKFINEIKEGACDREKEGACDRKYDLVYLDPPWDGKAYWRKSQMELYYGEQPAYKVIQMIFHKKITNTVFYKIPRNYKMSTLDEIVRDTTIKYTMYKIASKNVKKLAPDYYVVVFTKENE
jgi:16S rRNA G966 N2-methylase RsmD